MRRRSNLVGKRLHAHNQCHEQECIANILLYGIAEVLKHGYPTDIELATVTAQLEEAKIHLTAADNFRELAWHPRRAKKNEAKK
jgi:hypothetical protein